MHKNFRNNKWLKQHCTVKYKHTKLIVFLYKTSKYMDTEIENTKPLTIVKKMKYLTKI